MLSAIHETLKYYESKFTCSYLVVLYHTHVIRGLHCIIIIILLQHKIIKVLAFLLNEYWLTSSNNGDDKEW